MAFPGPAGPAGPTAVPAGLGSGVGPGPMARLPHRRVTGVRPGGNALVRVRLEQTTRIAKLASNYPDTTA